MTVSARTLSDAQADVARPLYLLELGFSAVEHLSTRDDVTWNGQTWAANGVSVGRITPATADGAQTAEIILPNDSYAYSAIVLGEGVEGKSLRIWKLYGEPPFASEDAVQVFDGVMDVARMGHQVRITANSAGRNNEQVPHLVFAPPVFNHLPVPGTIVWWRGEKVILEWEK